jgi:hypothetical protein
VALPDTAPRVVVALSTNCDAQELTGPPGGNWPVSYTLWMAVPTGGGT